MSSVIGRQKERALFLSMISGDVPSRIFNVTGIGGVGKSTLVEEFARIARDHNCGVGIVNGRIITDPADIHNYPPVVEAIITLERTLRAGDCNLGALRARLDRYKKLHQQLSEKFVGQDAAAVGAILQVGVSAIRAGATVFPVAQPLSAVLTPELATKVSQAIAAHRRASDRRLLAQPTEELTSLLLDGLHANALERHRRIVLIFDEFELLPRAVEYWLRKLFTGEYGTLTHSIMLVLSGRVPIGQDWTARGQGGAPENIRHVKLDQFSDGEIVEYLMQSPVGANMDEAQRIASTLGASYRLPLALRLLVSNPDYLADVVRAHGKLGLFADDIVDRLLDDRYTDAEQRQTALAAAVPRRFDLSIVTILEPTLEASHARSLMDWLAHQHFINPHTIAYTYYDLIRDTFLSYLENTDRLLLQTLHSQMRQYYADFLSRGGYGERTRSAAIELAYHQLSSTSDDVLTEALGLLFEHLPAAYEYGFSWSRMLRQVVTERDELIAVDRRHLSRLANVLERSSLQSALPDDAADDRAADPALNILFTSSFDDSLPKVSSLNAELWLAYFESRLNISAGERTELESAFGELERIWRSANDLITAGYNERLLAFRAVSDLADIYTRRGDLANALRYSQLAIQIAREDDAPIREAFALYQLSNNQKRQGEYRSALTCLAEAVDLVRRNPSKATSYYIGRFLLDQGVTLTYLSDPRAEESFEASRASLADISPVAYAELSHRLGWLKRVRGDLSGALADHQTAIKLFREVESGLGALPGRPSHVSYSLAKVLHSLGNVYVEMCRHKEALAVFAEAKELFARQAGVRHVAIVRKDRAWSRFLIDGVAEAEEDLVRAVTELGPLSTDRERPAVNSATHLAEGWLTLALIRAVTGRLDEADEAAETARELVGRDENPLLLLRLDLQCGLNDALGGRRDAARAMAIWASQQLSEQPQPHWLLVARAVVVEAAAALAARDRTTAESRLLAASEAAARWNEFGPLIVSELWRTIEAAVETVDDKSVNAIVGAGDHDPAAEEIIDVYDEHGQILGQASNRLAHSIGLWHRSFHCWIAYVDANGVKQIVLQRRGPFARNFADHLDMSAAGHLRTGEGVEGGVRECREELGIEVNEDDLIPIARRRINESLPSGMVNREFQEIYLLRQITPIDEYAPSYPEVSAVVECELDMLSALVFGEIERLRFHGVTATAAGEFSQTAGEFTVTDLIQESRAYHRKVFKMISELLDSSTEEIMIDNKLSAVSERLSDGSEWQALR